MASASDSRDTRTPPDRFAEGLLLRRFQAARAAGDLTQARRHMAELLVHTHDVIATIVRIERRHAERVSLRAYEDEELVSEVTIRVLSRLAETFEGRATGQLRAAVAQTTRYVCLDLARSAMHREQRTAREDGEAWADGDERRTRLERELDRLAAEAAADADADGAARARDFLAWALPRLPERRREVLVATHEGLPGDVIAERLGISRDLVYKERERAIAQLRVLWEEWIDGP